jgi:streptogramin lyase
MFAFIVAFAGPGHANGVILSGTITSAAGEKMGGVTVSAKAEGSTITTSVFTDDSGAYYFPPQPSGKYRVWAQALSFETVKGTIDLGAAKRQDFVLKPAKDYFQQLPGDIMLAALPGDTPEDFRMKTQVRKNCTGCHTASYPLQHKFDEAGWNAILELMKRINVFGHYFGADHKGTPNIDFHQKELAAYLARARGPGDSSMKVTLPPRPKGETARVVFKEYDFPKEPGNGPPVPSNDGSDWSLGTPSDLNGMVGVHDVQADNDGHLWIAYSLPSKDTTVAKVDARTGAVKKFGIPDIKGFAAGSHGIVRDEHGDLWFNIRSTVERGHGGLARINPKTEKISVFYPPKPMSGTAGTLDVDLKGNVWVTSPDGALRFDIAKETFTEFKSVSYRTPHGVGTVYGLAVDRTGNGWWAIMSQDLMDYSDIATGKTGELKLPPEQAVMENLSPEQRKFYETFVAPDFNTPFAWAQGPRRLGADKIGDHVWVGNSWGGNLARIDIRTKEVRLVPLPNPEAHQPYQIQVDSKHNVWTNLWSTDKVARYDPAAGQWTLFDLPNRGSEARYIAIAERDGKLEVILPYYRTRKVAVMTFRSEAEIAELKAQAER